MARVSLPPDLQEDPNVRPRGKTLLTGLVILVVVGSLVAFVAIRSRRMNAEQSAALMEECFARQDAGQLAKFINEQELYGFHITEKQAAEVIKKQVFPFCNLPPKSLTLATPKKLDSSIHVRMRGKLGNDYSFKSDIGTYSQHAKVDGLLYHLLMAAAFGSYSGKLPHSTTVENDAYVLLPYLKANQPGLAASGVTSIYDPQRYTSASIAKLIPSYEQELKHRASKTSQKP